MAYQQLLVKTTYEKATRATTDSLNATRLTRTTTLAVDGEEVWAIEQDCEKKSPAKDDLAGRMTWLWISSASCDSTGVPGPTDERDWGFAQPDALATSMTHGTGADAATTTYDYGRTGQSTDVTLPGLTPWHYVYDDAYRLIRIEQPTGSTKQTFAYDALDRVTQQTRGALSRAYTHSEALEALSDATMRMTTSAGTVKVMQDALGRQYARTLAPSVAGLPGLGAVELELHPDGRTARIVETRTNAGVDNTTTIPYEYDGRDRLIRIGRPDAEVRCENYTTFDLPQTVVTPNGSFTRGYDGLGRLSSMGSTAITWEPGSGRLTKLSGGGLTETRCYDGRGWVTQVANVEGDAPEAEVCGSVAEPLQAFAYEYDGRGNRTKETWTSGAVSEQTTYAYDRADRLTGVAYPSGPTVLYDLAADGTRLGEKHLSSGPPNLSFETTAGLTKHLEYLNNTAGQLGEIRDGLTQATVATLGYDAAGRTTSWAQNGQTRTFTWDVEDRLRGVDWSGGASARYDYDHSGMRLSATTGGLTTRFVWGAGELLEEQAPGGAVHRYLREGELVVGVSDERLLHDALGTIVGRWSAAGVVASHRFDAWGNYNASTAPPSGEAPTIGYTGHHVDTIAGLTYAKARWYAPELGRFLSIDPIDVTDERLLRPIALSTFSYANVSPVRFSDPTGMDAGDVGRGFLDGAQMGLARGLLIGGGLGFAGANVQLTGPALWVLTLLGAGGLTAMYHDVIDVSGNWMVVRAQYFDGSSEQSQIDFQFGQYLGGIVGDLTGGFFGALSGAKASVAWRARPVFAPRGNSPANASKERALTRQSDVEFEVAMGEINVAVAQSEAAVAQSVADRVAYNQVAARTSAEVARLESLAPASARPAVELANPHTIRFSQDSVGPKFSGGGTLQDSIAGLKGGTIAPESFPPIRTFERDGLTYTLDNRRLYVFREVGVPIRTVAATPEEIAKDAWKFTTRNNGVSVRVRRGGQ